MKRSTPGLKLVQAVSGFVQYKAAEALSPRSLETYQDHLDRWQEYIGDVDVSRVSTQQVRAFLAWRRAECTTHSLRCVKRVSVVTWISWR